MLLSADAIRQEVEAGGDLVITPYDATLLKPASYVMRLGPTTRRWNREGEPIVLWDPAGDPEPGPPDTREAIVLEPGEVVLGSTHERVTLPSDLVGFISTLSHLARCGISVHCNSFLVSPGFGTEAPTVITLELTSANARSIVLRPGLPICHLALMRVESPTHDLDRPLGKSVYEGDTTPSGPKTQEEFRPLLGDM